jgi:beta-1,4-mannosyltransferase
MSIGGSKLFYIFLAPIKFFYLLFQLWWTLCSKKFDFIIVQVNLRLTVQNPPSLPTLAVCIYAAWRGGGQCIVDWHNFGDTLLALAVGQRHPLVPLYRWYERFFGRRAHQHWAVTEAMKQSLRQLGITAPIHVHRDRPPPFFRRLEPAQRQAFFTAELPTDRCFFSSAGPFPFDKFLSAKPPALVVSGTSWTPDEDFSILIDAVARLDKFIADRPEYPQVVVVVTGPEGGPQRRQYEEQMASLNLVKCSFYTMWLHISHYPRLLGVADFGVSLHFSSSGT